MTPTISVLITVIGCLLSLLGVLAVALLTGIRNDLKTVIKIQIRDGNRITSLESWKNDLIELIRMLKQRKLSHDAQT
jgi:hypothetical protein